MSKFTLYNSDASENGYKLCDAIGKFVYIESEAMERVADLSEEEINQLIEDGTAFVWDADIEWDDFEGNYKDKMNEQYGYVLDGTVRAWDGVYAGGKVYFEGQDLFGQIFRDVCKDAYDMDVTVEDGDMHINTYDHDGGMSFTVRAITAKDTEYYNENPDDLEESEMSAKLMEKGIKAEKFLNF